MPCNKRRVVKKNRVTSAGIIEKEGVPESRMIILNRVPGVTDDHSPYRAELAGVCGTITAIEKNCRTL